MLDATCGTGRHAALFHSWGLEVEAADNQPGHDRPGKGCVRSGAGLARRASGPTSKFCRGGWCGGLASRFFRSEPFDAIVCVGNSLALAPDRATAETAILQMLAALRPGGLLVVQLLNLWRLPDGPCVWQKCRCAMLPRPSPLPPGEGQGEGRRITLRASSPADLATEVLVLKGVHRCDSRGYVDLAVVEPAGPKLLHSESSPLLGLEASDLEAMARTPRPKNHLLRRL